MRTLLNHRTPNEQTRKAMRKILHVRLQWTKQMKLSSEVARDKNGSACSL